ncbi:hypothetical protein FB007_10917 [Sinorhizobium medicae]|nr:hypothetical protein FB007_10917 [Sinorhizobium medicae]
MTAIEERIPDRAGELAGDKNTQGSCSAPADGRER